MADLQYTPGRFVWHELSTSDLAASKRFYGELLGWGFEELDDGEMAYTLVTMHGHPVGGMMQRPGPHIPSHFLCYVSVRDVKATAARARELGGAVLTELDLPVGPLAVLQDPQGAAFAVWTSADGDPPEVSQPELATFCWDQLNTSDPDAAASFYTALFGWTRQPFPGGGDVSILMRGERQAASLMQAPQGTFAHWLTYLLVADLAGAREQVKSLGGQVLVSEIPVPGLGAYCVIQDNVGAIVALFQPSMR